VRLRQLLVLGICMTVVAVVCAGLPASAARLITGRDIKDGTVTSADVKNGSLLKADFKSGQLPAGPRGPAGPQGPVGPAGDANTKLYTWTFSHTANGDANFNDISAMKIPARSIVEGLDLVVDGITPSNCPSYGNTLGVSIQGKSTVASYTPYEGQTDTQVYLSSAITASARSLSANVNCFDVNTFTPLPTPTFTATLTFTTREAPATAPITFD
jgi:hypothetical protein